MNERVADPTTAWQRVVIQGWYGRTQHRLDIATGTALWHHPGRRVLIRWVLVRDPEGGREPQAFLCTDLNAEPTEILGWFVRRWRVEVTFAEVRRHLGVETQRQWSDRAILRTTPALLGLFSLSGTGCRVTASIGRYVRCRHSSWSAACRRCRGSAVPH